MTETMIERVARAINAEAEGPDGRGWNDEDLRTKANCRAEARAAIEAMREPTEEMLRSVLLSREIAGQVWQAMIDAALDEKAKT